MPKYRVTLRVSRSETIEADNPYQAAALISTRHGGDVEIADVRPAVGRVATKKTTKKVAKKRRKLSPEARAKLAQNLVKARAARAAKRNGAKKTTKKSVKKRTARKATKKR